MAAGGMISVKKAGTTIAMVRSVSYSVTKTPIDISSADSNGWQLLMTTAAQRVVNITVAGVESDHVLRDLADSGTDMITDLTLVFPNALTSNDTLTVNWFMTDYKEEGDYKSAGTFSATMTSSGAPVRS